MTRRVILLTAFFGEFLDKLRALLEPLAADIVVATDRAELDIFFADGIRSRLICFGSGVIVPQTYLEALDGPSYNVHAASPEYPGRDPHHFAVFEGATTYGATLHVMTRSVDAGPIVDFEEFPVMPSSTPAALLEQANEAGLRLVARHAAKLVAGDAPLSSTLRWVGKKRSRKDFLDACKLDTAISREEFERHFLAFDGGTHNNLTVELHGWTFRIDKSSKEP